MLIATFRPALPRPVLSAMFSQGSMDMWCVSYRADRNGVARTRICWNSTECATRTDRWETHKRAIPGTNLSLKISNFFTLITNINDHYISGRSGNRTAAFLNCNPGEVGKCSSYIFYILLCPEI